MNASSAKPGGPTPDSWLTHFWRDHQAVATIIAALMGAGVVIFAAAAFRPIVNVFTDSPPVGPTVVAPSPVATTAFPTLTSPTVTTPAPTPDPTPSIKVRRHSGKEALTLSRGYRADLDSMDSAWDVQNTGNSDEDIQYYQGELYGESDSDIAIVSGSAKYETCRDATSYQPSLDEEELDEGLKLCVRTSEKRRAFIMIEKVAGWDQIQFDVVVWDPPFEE